MNKETHNPKPAHLPKAQFTVRSSDANRFDRDQNASPKLTIVTDVPFWNQRRGSNRRISVLVDYLRTVCRVTVCFVGELPVSQWNVAAETLECDLIGPGMPGGLAMVVAKSIAGLLPERKKAIAAGQAQPVTLADFRSDVISNFVCSHVRDAQPDIVLLEYITMSYLCEAIAAIDFSDHSKPTTNSETDPTTNSLKKPLTIIDSHDLMHVRCNSFQQFGFSHWLSVSKSEELSALDLADIVLAIQEEEADFLKQHLQSANVCLAKHAASDIVENTNKLSGERVGKIPETANIESSLELSSGLSLKSSPDSAPLTIGFVGSRGIANRIGLRAFLKNCWPTIQSTLGTRVRLKIGGGLTESDFESDIYVNQQLQPSLVEFSGSFDHPAEFYANIDVAINPGLVPSGMKIKSLSALAHGVPLVSTSAGMAGLKHAENVCALTADDWREFSSHILKLADDRVRLKTLTTNCQPFIEQNFLPNLVFADLTRLIVDAVQVNS